MPAAAATQSRTRRKAPRGPAGARLLVASFLLMALVNALAANRGPGFPKTNAELSDLNPTYLTPDGMTFAIWGVIYLLELLSILEITLGRPSFYLPRREAALSNLALAFLLNTVWLLVFARELYGTALAVMVCYLLALVRTYLEIDTLDTDIFLPSAVSINLAWVCVATSLNALIAAARLDLAGSGEVTPSGVKLPAPAGTPGLASVAVLSLMLIAISLLAAWRDWPFAATVAWALWGIQRNQAEGGAPLLAQSTGMCAGICFLGAAYVMFCGNSCPCSSRRSTTRPEATRGAVTVVQPIAPNGGPPAAHPAADEGGALEAQFGAAQEALKRVQGLGKADKLTIYATYKWATCGPPQGPRPGALDPVGRAKHDAWAALEALDGASAKRKYVELADKFAPGWR